MNANLGKPIGEAIDYDPFAGGGFDKVVPTTEAQREVWLADQHGESASLAFNEAIALRLRGRLDLDALRQALDGLPSRHESLRATLTPDGMSLMIASSADLPLTLVDLRAVEPKARDAAVGGQCAAVVEEPFDLVAGPLVRARLLLLGDDDHLLLLSAHHIVCDGWSFGVLARDLAALYLRARGGRSGDSAELAPANAFSDYVAAEDARAGSAEQAADERYWLSCFDDGAPVLDLPTDRPRPLAREFASRRLDIDLDAGLVGDLRKLASRNGASLFTILLGSFAALLGRLAGQREVVVGVPTAGQAVADMPELVGHCVNLLPIRTTVDPDASGLDLLAHTQARLLDAFEHQRTTFGTMLRKLQLPRDPSRLPLVSVMFNLDQKLDGDTLGFGDLEVEVRSVPRHFENFELFVNACQVDDRVRLECQYNTGLFDEATVRFWLESYETLLRGMLEAPGQALGRLELLGPEQEAKLAEWNATRVDYDAAALVQDLVWRQAERTPDAAAVLAGSARLSYAELRGRAMRIADALRARGVRRGGLVGLCVERGVDMLAALLGILEAGAAYVPLDPEFPQDRLAYMAQDADLALLVTELSVAHKLAWPKERTLLLDEEANWGEASPDAQGDRAQPEDPAYVIYTSGSTGKPKGVAVPHRAVVNFLTGMQAEPGLDSTDRLVAVTTLSFDIAVLELLLPLTVGARTILASRAQALDGQALRSLLETSRATVMQATPAGWRLLLEAGWEGATTMKALVGGEPLPPELARELLDRGADVWNMYGPTETTIWSTCWRVDQPERGIVIGRPIANTQVQIVDDQGARCPIGATGEVWIGGDGVAIGYLGRPELTAERFLPDPFSSSDGGRLYRTGDRGRWRSDGTLEHLGRLDSQVKVRGFRIELGEIESVLRTHPAVADALAIVREDRPGDVRLVAYVVPRGEAELAHDELAAHLRRSVPDYMVPQHHVVLDALPRLPNRKVDRNALPVPEAGPRRVAAADEPQTELQRVVAAVFQAVLGLPELGLHDDFFSLGGHSLLAAQAIARLNRDLSIRLSMRSLFEAPTIAALSRLIEAELTQGRSDEMGDIAPRSDRSVAPLSLVQQRLWFLESLHPGRTVYNTPSAHRLRGRIDESALQRAFDYVVGRHEVLRTTIDTVDGEAFQRIHDRVAVKLFPAEDLGAIPADRRDEELRTRLDALVGVPFDLGKSPLFVARMFRLSEEEHVLFFMPHHIVWDGWSFDLFYEEMSAAYLAYLDGGEPGLPPLRVSYGDYCVWQQGWLQSPEFDRQSEYWRARLREQGPVRELMTDMPRQAGMSGTGAMEWVRVSRATADQLRDLGQRHDATLFMTLLSAYSVLLTAVGATGQQRIGVPVQGRTLAATEPLMGYFTNLLPIALAFDPAEPFSKFLARVKRVLLEAFAYPDVPLERLVDAGTIQGRGAAMYQALFSFQDARRRPVDWGNIRHDRIEVAQQGATEDFGLWLVEQRNGLVGGITYNADLYRAASAVRLREHFESILERVIAAPDAPVGSLVSLTPEEAERLRAWAAQESPGSPAIAPSPASSPSGPSPASRPGTPTEEALAEIWESLLGVKGIGRGDNFFDLGGNSLLVMQAVGLMERRIGRRVDPRRYIFESLAQIARGYDEADAVSQYKPGIMDRLFRRMRRAEKPDTRP